MTFNTNLAILNKIKRLKAKQNKTSKLRGNKINKAFKQNQNGSKLKTLTPYSKLTTTNKTKTETEPNEQLV